MNMKTTNQSKINIAKEYVEAHKDFVITGYEPIFNKLVGGVFGSLELIDEEIGEYQIEIGSAETKTGNPVIFTFIDPDFIEKRCELRCDELREDEDFTDLDLLHFYEDGEAMGKLGISEIEADEMHDYLKQKLRS